MLTPAGRVRSAALVALLAITALALLPLARAGGAGAGGNGDGPRPLDTTDADFFQLGTQPTMDGFVELLSAEQCRICHANYDPVNEPYTTWAASMLGQSARDPLVWAAIEVTNRDITDGGQYCLRCHAPNAFLGDRLDPPDGSAFTPEDFEGVACSVCHRMLDPVYVDGVSPPEDFDILQALADDRAHHEEGLLPREGSNAQYIVDPSDVRRGPYDDLPFNPHIGVPPPPVIPSPFHRTSELCWTCHDVSNPLTIRREDGTYTLGPLDAPHRSIEQTDMFPLHRTYSEWLNSWYFTQDGVQHHGRFGGNHPTGIMNVCQDCHMPDQIAFGCGLGPPFVERPDMPQHSFVGANTWVLNAVRDLFPDTETGLSADSVSAAIARNVDMLEKASDLSVTQAQSVIRTRVVNQSGHKIPTGFPDGRRIWVNAKFYDADQNLMDEVGDYDFETATLDADRTTVYECRLGVDETQSELTGLPVGETFHFMLANEVVKDNRIPPQGFSNVVALENQTEPVGVTFANGQHWHDTEIFIPERAAQAVVTVYYQLTSREFIEFLRDNGGDRGAIAYEQWEAHGKSRPVVMDMVAIELRNPADVNRDGVVDFQDLLLLLSFWGNCPDPPAACPVDINNDTFIDFRDLLLMLAFWTPPITPTGACCFDDGTCQPLEEVDCGDQGGAYSGDEVTCDDAACPQPTGACCFDDGSCQVLEETDCSGQGGIYSGNDVTCPNAACPQPTGACCFDDGSCQVLEETDCSGQGGIYSGDDVTCPDAACPQPIGACCFEDGSCQVLEETDCSGQGGVYSGDGVTCPDAACPQPTGACCFDDGSCQVLEEAVCSDQAGLYSGDDVTCQDAACPQPEGACCLNDGTCTFVVEEDCDALGGAFAGAEVACADASCAEPTIETHAGNGDDGYSGDGGPATEARIREPLGLAADADGNVYIADRGNHRVRRVDAVTGVITTFAGDGGGSYDGDGGPATSAGVKDPYDVAVDADGNVFIAMKSNDVVRRVDADTGIITTYAGTGGGGYEGDGGPATDAKFDEPIGLAVDMAGNLYICDSKNDRVRRVDVATGIITTIAGNGSSGYEGDGGPATAARLRLPVGVDVDAAGNFYIADRDNDRIRRVDGTTGIITTLAGTGSEGYSGDGGPATNAEIAEPNDVATDADGNVYIADKKNERIRRVDVITGIITTYAGNGTGGYSGDGGPATSARIDDPVCVAVDKCRRVYLGGKGGAGSRIRRVEAGTCGP